nr:unnamed protein product [Callosobruchus chinensis]
MSSMSKKISKLMLMLMVVSPLALVSHCWRTLYIPQYLCSGHKHYLRSNQNRLWLISVRNLEIYNQHFSNQGVVRCAMFKLKCKDSAVICTMLVFLEVFLFTCALFGTHQANLLEKHDGFQISVVHINDFHARYLETSNGAGACKSKNSCVGGFSRLYNQIMKMKKENPDSILLNAGDNFQGTLWYTIGKWNLTQEFMNKLPFDAAVLGNHEFDDGIDGVVPYIKSLRYPVVVSNIDDSLETKLQGTYTKSTVLQRRGKKIGIIGVTVSNCPELSHTGKLKFLPESASVNAEADRLVKQEGVFTNIVLSHAGYDKDLMIAANASEKISLIVGGHTHTFLYTGGNHPGSDNPEGPYPTVVKSRKGQDVLITQAAAFSKYVGNITVKYNGYGQVTDYSGAPILLSHNLPQDEKINRALLPWKTLVDAQGQKVIGSTLVTLDQTSCQRKECTLGNFITDAMVFGVNITYDDLSTVSPFGDTIDVGEIEGKYLKDLFEDSAEPTFYKGSFNGIRLLQVSGIRVTYDLSQPKGSRVINLKIRCQNCTIPIYEPLDMTKTYRLITCTYLAHGGNGYSILKDHLKNVQTGGLDLDVYTDYLAHRSPVYQEIERRSVIRGIRAYKNNCNMSILYKLYFIFLLVWSTRASVIRDNDLFELSVIMKMLEEKPHSVLLNAGDDFQGTMYYSIGKWNITQEFMNKLPFDAQVLGNHEFDDGIEGVVPYIKALKHPVIVSNIDDSLEPKMQGIYSKSTIIERNGKKIGIVGVIVEDCDEISNTGKLRFLPESASVNAEAERLVEEEGVFTVIVLSHSGYDHDRLMAKNASDKISLIVGGHSHTFLYTGASAFSKYLGNVTVYLDKNGEIADFVGAPIFLSPDLAQDEKINQALAPWKKMIDAQGSKIIGSTLVTLDKLACYHAECTLGNFMADAMVYAYTKKSNEYSWTQGAIAMTNSGGGRTTIEVGNITLNDMITAAPFGNTIDIGNMKGKYVKALLERNMFPYTYYGYASGVKLMQYSGVQIVFDMSRPIGNRVVSAKLRCQNCTIPVYEDLDEDKTYRIIVPSFLEKGGDGYTEFRDYLTDVQIGPLDIDVFVDYLSHRSPVFEEIEGRTYIRRRDLIVDRNSWTSD